MDTRDYFKSIVEQNQEGSTTSAMKSFRAVQSSPSQYISAPSQFSGQETEALTAYKGFGFSSINQTVRANPSALSNEGRQVVNTLDILTHAGVVEKDFTVHRGFRHPSLEGGGSLVGKEFTESGFASTSLNPYVPEEFARTAKDFTSEIRLKKGSKGFLLASHETWRQGDKESEFILPRGTKFRVLEEHAAESSWRPRHLVLEAITPEHAPTPLQLGRQVAQEVRPSVGGAAATAEKMVAKETEHILHTNLESGVGKFLKNIMKLPFKSHSRLDPLAAAVQATEAFSNGGLFGGVSYVGILTTGVLALGAAITLKGWKAANEAVDTTQGGYQYSVPPTPTAPLHGNNDVFSIHRTQTQGPDGSTRLHIDDAELNHMAVDEAFTKHLKYGLAHSSR